MRMKNHAILQQTLTCNLKVLFVINALMGMSNTITPNPASVEGPSCFHKKNNARKIWYGAKRSINYKGISSDSMISAFIEN